MNLDLGGVVAAIPYRTFPTLPIGPIDLRTFGLFVALGVLAGIALSARLARVEGFTLDDITRIGTRLVIAGVVGARLTWVVTHWEAVENPIDVIAVWEGGLQFSGGFLAAIAVALPELRRIAPARRWRLIDSLVIGLAAGLAIGRIGCYAVGEHFGRPTSFFLGTRYLGGETREPAVVGQVFHNTSLYEFLHLAVLVALLVWFVNRRPAPRPGMAAGLFAIWYGVARFATDSLRAFDDRVLGLTGAQWMSLVLVPAGLMVVYAARRGRTTVGPAPEQEDQLEV